MNMSFRNYCALFMLPDWGPIMNLPVDERIAKLRDRVCEALYDHPAMRSAVARAGRDPRSVNPLVPVDLVIDHSVQVDLFRTPEAYLEDGRYRAAMYLRPLAIWAIEHALRCREE